MHCLLYIPIPPAIQAFVYRCGGMPHGLCILLTQVYYTLLMICICKKPWHLFFYLPVFLLYIHQQREIISIINVIPAFRCRAEILYGVLPGNISHRFLLTLSRVLMKSNVLITFRETKLRPEITSQFLIIRL